jgi:DNA-binding NarL/FixJ family response regulator
VNAWHKSRDRARAAGEGRRATAMNDAATSCVLLADRHHSLTEGVRGLLETAFSTVFMVADEASLVEGAQRLQPSVIVADLSLAPGDSLGFVRRLRARAGAAKLLLLTVHDEPTVAHSAIAAGADGVVLKRAIAADLLLGIESILDGVRYVSPGMRGRDARIQDTPAD